MRTIRTWAVLAALLCVVTSSLVAQDKTADKDKKPATLVLEMPADAVLYVGGVKMDGKGTTRKYATPALTPGKKYEYEIKSVREPNNYTRITRTRKAYVKAGETTTLDLTGADDPKQPDQVVVRYVPTPDAVVEKMLEMTKCGKNDVVFDIGCGDGRMVIAGVKKFGAKKGVGIDLDPERIKESKWNAVKENVWNKVTFRQEDALKVTDLEDATVVVLYVGGDLMEQLRPIFSKRLKPGTRIVSHRFTWDVKKWPADKTVVHKAKDLRDKEAEFTLHLWTVPEKEKKDDKKD